MQRKVRYVVPEAPSEKTTERSTPQRKIGKNGIRLGVLDNNKGNADHLLALMLERVRAELPIASVVSLKKPAAVVAAPAATLDQLAGGAECVIGAMAD